MVERKIKELEQQEKLHAPVSTAGLSLTAQLYAVNEAIDGLAQTISKLETRLGPILPILVMQDAPSINNALPPALAEAELATRRVAMLTSRLEVIQDELVV